MAFWGLVGLVALEVCQRPLFMKLYDKNEGDGRYNMFVRQRMIEVLRQGLEMTWFFEPERIMKRVGNGSLGYPESQEFTSETSKSIP